MTRVFKSNRVSLKLDDISIKSSVILSWTGLTGVERGLINRVSAAFNIVLAVVSGANTDGKFQPLLYLLSYFLQYKIKYIARFLPSWSAIKKALLWLEFAVLCTNKFETLPRTPKPD